MEPQRRYSQKVKKGFHISMAAMDISESGEGPCQVMCALDGRNYLLCTLRKPDIIQCTLDLEFVEGSEVSFASNGNARIHLTGYITDLDDDTGLSLEDLEEEEEDEEVAEEEQKTSKKKNKTSDSGPPKKKAKINGTKQEIKTDSDDDDESSDEEDNEEEEAENEEDSSDEAEEEESGDEESAEEESSAEEEVKEEPPKPAKNKKEQKQKQPVVNGLEQKKEKQQGKSLKKKLDGGVEIEDLKVGEGAVAKAGKFVSVHYEGRLQKNNKMFDSCLKNPGFKFRLGQQEVIKGWDVGVAGMKVGGKRKIVCPPHTAYGAKGSPPVIPPNSTLVFTVELKKVH